jgi:hypothetical protein
MLDSFEENVDRHHTIKQVRCQETKVLASALALLASSIDSRLIT